MADGSLMPLVLLLIAAGAYGTITEVVTTGPIDLGQVPPLTPICTSFIANDTNDLLGWVVGAFDVVILRGLVFPCSANLSAWLEMDGLPQCAFSGTSCSELFVYPGDPCTVLNGVYMFTDQGTSFQSAVCPGWPPVGGPALSVSDGKYQPQGYTPNFPATCNQPTLAPAPFKVFEGIPYTLTLKLCMMHTMPALAIVDSGVFSAEATIYLEPPGTSSLVSSVSTSTLTSTSASVSLAAALASTSTTAAEVTAAIATTTSESSTTFAVTAGTSTSVAASESATTAAQSSSTAAASTAAVTSSAVSTAEASTTSLASAEQSTVVESTTAVVAASTDSVSSLTASAAATATTASEVASTVALTTGEAATLANAATISELASSLASNEALSSSDTTTTAASFSSLTASLVVTRTSSVSADTTVAETTASAAQTSTTSVSSTTAFALAVATVLETTALSATLSVALLDITATSTASTAGTLASITTTAVRAATLGSTRAATVAAVSSTSIAAAAATSSTPVPGSETLEPGTVIEGDWMPPAEVVIQINSTAALGAEAVVIVAGQATLEGVTIVLEFATPITEDTRVRLVQAGQVNGAPLTVIVRAPKGPNCTTVSSRPDPGPTVFAVLLHPVPHECRKVDRPFLLASVVVGGVLLTALIIYVACWGIMSTKPDMLKFVKSSYTSTAAKHQSTDGVYNRF